MTKVALYDNLAGSYDTLISWKRRLRRERPLLTGVFKQFKVRRILDTACGTDMHAIAFHDWDYHVVGADISEPMVKQSRHNAGGKKIEFIQAGFTDTEKIGGMFDAVTCLGNSLPHVLTDEALDASLAAFRDQLLPGGILVIHNNNYDRILGARERFMPPAQGRKDGRVYLFLRFFDFLQDDLLTFNLITLSKKSGEWQMFPDASTHRALTRGLLVERLAKAGFINPEVYGSYAGDPFVELESDNLIIVAQKPHNIASRPVPEPVAAIDRVPVRESGQPLVNVEEAIPGILVRKAPQYARRTVAEMVREARGLLPEGYNLIVRTGYRSLEFQETMYRKYYQQIAEKRPDWGPSQLRREINKYLAPPDAKHPPGHTTGGAVDLAIVGPDGEELDMTSTIKPVENANVTFATYSKLITPRAAKNRQMLVDIMLEVGFSNFPGEWWHYSYGDSAWALRVHAPEAIYGAANPPRPLLGEG